MNSSHVSPADGGNLALHALDAVVRRLLVPLVPGAPPKHRIRYQWDEETADDSIEGVKRQIAAIGASDEPLSEAQARKLDKRFASRLMASL